MSSDPRTGSHDHVPVNGGKYLGDGGYQDDSDAMGMSVGMSLKFVPDQIVHQIKIWGWFSMFYGKK